MLTMPSCSFVPFYLKDFDNERGNSTFQDRAQVTFGTEWWIGDGFDSTFQTGERVDKSSLLQSLFKKKEIVFIIFDDHHTHVLEA